MITAMISDLSDNETRQEIKWVKKAERERGEAERIRLQRIPITVAVICHDTRHVAIPR